MATERYEVTAKHERLKNRKPVKSTVSTHDPLELKKVFPVGYRIVEAIKISKDGEKLPVALTEIYPEETAASVSQSPATSPEVETVAK